MNLTYLMINFFVVIIPFLFSFHPKLNFYKTWNAFFPAVILTGMLFIAADMYFTYLGVWGFNKSYLSGIRFFNIPIEEALFFLCIPYACVFTFFCLNIFFPKEINKKKEERFTLYFIVALAIAALFNIEKIYTSTTFLSLAFVLALSSYVWKVEWLGKFYLVYAVLLIPFFISNGLLTGTGLESPVVWYNNYQFMGIRILTIPVEDIFYGMELILINVLIYRYLLKRHYIRKVISKKINTSTIQL